MTHCRLSREKSSALAIEGNATFTIDTSRIVMKKAAHTTVSALQRSGSGTAVVVAAASIGSPPPVASGHRTRTNGRTPNRQLGTRVVRLAGEPGRRPSGRNRHLSLHGHRAVDGAPSLARPRTL